MWQKPFRDREIAIWIEATELSTQEAIAQLSRVKLAKLLAYI